MKIVNVRVDERLIHGQIAAYWTTFLSAHRIIVIDDMASGNDIQKMALKMACPSSVKLSIFSVNRAIEKLAEKPYEGENVFIVVKNPKTLRDLHDKGLVLSPVNVGNMSGKHGSVSVRRTVSVLPPDVENFVYLIDKGVEFYAQMVPSDNPVDFAPLVKAVVFE